MKNDIHRYDDIIGLPHYVSPGRTPMPRADRAAQFSPFAALTGFGGAIAETARLTEEKIELDEYAKGMLDRRLQLLREHISRRPEAAFTYFVPDERKSGGAYVTAAGPVKKLDDLSQTVHLADGTVIPMDDICAVDGDLFTDSGF